MEPQLVDELSQENAADGIPRIIHQTWKSADLPEQVSFCVQSVIRANPGWDHRFYTDEELAEVVAATKEITQDDFMSIPSGIERADAFKAAVLFLEGGVYCDVDIEAFQPFESIVQKIVGSYALVSDTELWLSPDHPIHCARLFGYPALKNHFMIAKPGASFLGMYLRELSEKSRTSQLGGDPVHSTGAAFLTGLVHKYGGAEALNVGVLPSEWINPLPDLTLDFPEILPYRNLVKSGQWLVRLKPHAAHYWWHSYCQRGDMLNEFREQLFATALRQN